CLLKVYRCSLHSLTLPYSMTPSSFFFFFHDTALTPIYTLSLHDALPIFDEQVAIATERILDEVEAQAVDAELHALFQELVADRGAVQADQPLLARLLGQLRDLLDQRPRPGPTVGQRGGDPGLERNDDVGQGEAQDGRCHGAADHQQEA